MAEDVRVELLGAYRRTSRGGVHSVFVHEALDSVNAESTPCPRREERFVPASRSFAHPDLEDRFGDGGQGNGAELATFTFAADAGTGTEGGVATVQPCEL